MAWSSYPPRCTMLSFFFAKGTVRCAQWPHHCWLICWLGQEAAPLPLSGLLGVHTGNLTSPLSRMLISFTGVLLIAYCKTAHPWNRVVLFVFIFNVLFSRLRAHLVGWNIYCFCYLIIDWMVVFLSTGKSKPLHRELNNCSQVKQLLPRPPLHSNCWFGKAAVMAQLCFFMWVH